MQPKSTKTLVKDCVTDCRGWRPGTYMYIEDFWEIIRRPLGRHFYQQYYTVTHSLATLIPSPPFTNSTTILLSNQALISTRLK